MFVNRNVIRIKRPITPYIFRREAVGSEGIGEDEAGGEGVVEEGVVEDRV